MSRLPGFSPEEIRIGMPVTARIESAEGQRVVVFEPREEVGK